MEANLVESSDYSRAQEIQSYLSGMEYFSNQSHALRHCMKCTDVHSSVTHAITSECLLLLRKGQSPNSSYIDGAISDTIGCRT